MNSKQKICRAAKYFASQASLERHRLRSIRDQHIQSGDYEQAEQLRREMHYLQVVIDGLGELMWELNGNMAIQCRKSTATRLGAELGRYLSDLTHSRGEEITTELLTARSYVLQQEVPMDLTIVESVQLQPAH